MAEVTRRFRADTTIPYAQALDLLTGYAREHDADFVFGPVRNVSALHHNGLTLTGEEAVIDRLTDFLERNIPGLVPVEHLDWD